MSVPSSGRRTPRQRLGTAIERLVAHHLEAQGYTLLARNWRCAYGELDLVAEREGVVIFFEVRARRSETFGTPEESLTPRKRAALIAAAQAFLAERGLEASAWQIDLVAVVLDAHGRVARLTHIPCAVEE
ncbi:MAG: YraN family protein [Thermoflexales bacterium]|nr:YraN family protein [Thermoflexales bacterium]MDW8291649.1 YraN family protein [Anaerolineae bacterium]